MSLRAHCVAIALLVTVLCACSSKSDSSTPTTVTPVAPTVQLGVAAIDMRGLGRDTTLQATVTPASTTVTWRSDNSAVATVTASGTTATVHSVTAGSAHILATATNGTLTASASAQLTVTPAVTSVTVTPLQDNVALGASRTFTAVVSADPGLATTVTWRTSNAAVASVSAAGLATALALGTVTITAVSVADTTKRGTATLVVSPPPFATEWTVSSLGTFPLPSFTRLAFRPDGLLYAVGVGGAISTRSVAGAWSAASSPVSSSQTLLALSVPSVDSAWTVGTGGTIARRSGATWVLEASGTTRDLQLLAMRADGTGFAGAFTTPAVLFERKAGTWRSLALPSANFRLSSLSVTAGVLWASGFDNSGANRVFQYDGVTWTQFGTTSPTSGPVFGLSDSDALLGGITPFEATPGVWHGANGTWTTEYDAVQAGSAWGTSQITRCLDGTLMASTSEGTALMRTGTSWSERSEFRLSVASTGAVGDLGCVNQNEWLSTVAGVLTSTKGGITRYESVKPRLTKLSLFSGSTAIASGPDAIAMRWDGSTWEPLLVPLELVARSGAAFAMTGVNSAIGAAEGFVGTWNGGGWTWLSQNIPYSMLWAAAPTDVWAAGPTQDNFAGIGSGLRRFNGGSWSNVFAANTPTIYYAVHGASANAVFAVGSATRSSGSGVVTRATATGIKSDTISQVFSDVAVFSANAAVAITGAVGSAWRFDGTTWTAIPVPTAERLTTITGRSATEVYAFGDGGGLFGWNGVQWSRIATLPSVVRSARMVGNAGLAIGDDGLVLKGRVIGAAVLRR